MKTMLLTLMFMFLCLELLFVMFNQPNYKRGLYESSKILSQQIRVQEKTNH
jgi:hypothetical protein